MAGRTPKDPRAARLLARRQYWVISRRQLLALGYTRHAIYHRVERGSLYRIFRGVYAVGRPEVSRFGWWIGAVLACGPGAVLSHWSAAALWGILPSSRGPIHISSSSDHEVRGIKSHRRVLEPGDVTVQHNIPVTSPIRTLIDIAGELTRDELEGAVSAADKLGLTDPEELREACEGRIGITGVPKLSHTLDRRTYVMTETELERRFLPISRRAGLPLPLTQVHVTGFRVDFYWPGLGLVVETDGLTYHRTPAQQAKDRVRDQAHVAAGLIPLRFTRAQVRYEPGQVEGVLKAVAVRLLPRGR
jgi:very-short-patch-repair endonuclease